MSATIRWVIGGALLMFLAPLAGFLVGTIVGGDRAVGGLDPMFAYLFFGMVIGGIGGLVALLAALRWSAAGRAARQSEAAEREY